MKAKVTYLWRNFAQPHWVDMHEETLRKRVGSDLVVVTRPNCNQALLEAACKSRMHARHLAKEFGGRVEKLPGDWLNRFSREQKRRPLKIGKRLIVVCSLRKREANSSPYSLIIPASAAFGTGEHVTTAMSLRLLEQATRNWKRGWSIVDLGTGSGILALAAKRFGASHVLAIDNDPIAISVAKENVRLNKIDNVDFKIGDVRRWKSSRKIDIITANLFSELLIEILPKLKQSRWLILSGILRKQEPEFLRALRRNKFHIAHVRRRGKWIAILAQEPI